MDIKKATDDLAKVEGKIQAVHDRIDPSTANFNPHELLKTDWYQRAQQELQPYYERARYLQDVIMSENLRSLTESSNRLEKSSERLTKITWLLLGVTVVLTVLTAVLVLRVL